MERSQASAALAPLVDVALLVPTSDQQHVQEIQLVVIHLLCALLEQRITAGRRPQGAGESSAWTTWELRVVGAGRRFPVRVAAQS